MPLCGIVAIVKLRNYKNQGTFDIAIGRNSKSARKLLPVELHQIARKRFVFMKSIKRFDELQLLNLELHKLRRNRHGQWSIKINDQYRVCFVYEDDEEFLDVEIIDYH
jgi:toxin HigB-1